MRSHSLKVAAVQVDSVGRLRDVEERSEKMVLEAARDGARLICLPEHWLPGGPVNLEDSLSRFRNAARKTGTYVVPGADFVRRGNATTVESVMIDPQGNELGRQLKTHLFGREKRMAVPGEDYRIFEVDDIKVGIAICHDLVYPEVVRIFAIKGAELVLAPSKISSAGLEPWELYVKARALENRIPIVSPAALSGPRFPGRSMIVGLSRSSSGIVYPEMRALAKDRPTVLMAEIDLGAIKAAREERLASRRSTTYRELVN